MTSGNNFFGSENMNGSEVNNFQQNVEGNRGQQQNGGNGNENITGGAMNQYYYQHLHPPHQFALIPPQIDIEWAPLSKIMCQEGNDASNGSSNRQDNTNWLDDAPMPTDERFNYPSSSSSHGSAHSDPELKQDSIATYPPYGLSVDDCNMSPTSSLSVPSKDVHPSTPNQLDISNLARLNLNPTPTDPPTEEQEPNVIEVYPKSNEDYLRESLDLNEKGSWCDFTYFESNEGNILLTEKFFPKSDRFAINNSAGRGTDDFGLASLPAPTTPATQKCRNELGKGLQIAYHPNGEVWMTVYTNALIFVLSRFTNYAEGLADNSVRRFQNPGGKEEEKICYSIKLFDTNTYKIVMRDIFEREGLDGCAEVVPSFCLIRISFCKGFGGEYPRHTIRETPCHFDLCLRPPLEDYDTLVRTVDNGEDVGSRS